MSKILIIGAAGQLGTELTTVFDGETVLGADKDSASYILNVENKQEVQACIHDFRADFVILTAAIHEPLFCEQHPDVSFRVNASGAFWTAQACRETGARMVYVSTDYVFGGCLPHPICPFTENDPPCPVNIYGMTKAAGEYLCACYCPNHLIIRTASLYGLASCRGKDGRNFIETMLSKGRSGQQVVVVDDEETTPTPTANLAHQIRVCCEQAPPGIYHAVTHGKCSWHEFARAIFEEFDLDIVPERSQRCHFADQFPRPHFSLLENKRLGDCGLDIMPTWQEGLKQYAVARRKRLDATA